MKITGYRVYLQRVAERPRVLLRVDTDEGISGWGEAFNHGPDKALVPIFEYLFDQITGIDPRRISFIAQKLFQAARFPPGALGLTAQSAIDHALWDISAKAAGLPVYMLLGGNARDRIPAYAGIYRGPKERTQSKEAMQALNEQYGFTAFKYHPFGQDLHDYRWGQVCDETAAFAADLRESSPAHWEFAFDAHGMMFEPQQAIRLGNALAPYDPLFFEEPVPPEHIPAFARIRQELKVPLATGERLYSRFEFLNLIASGGVDIIQPDICVVGGMLEMCKIATIADAHLVSVAPHNPMGPISTAASVHFAAATTNFKILEMNLVPDVPWIADPYVPEDGFIALRPDRPGWGIEIDEDYLERGDDYVHWARQPPIRPDGSVGYV